MPRRKRTPLIIMKGEEHELKPRDLALKLYKYIKENFYRLTYADNDKCIFLNTDRLAKIYPEIRLLGRFQKNLILEYVVDLLKRDEVFTIKRISRGKTKTSYEICLK